MRALTIEGTEYTPKVQFTADGQMTLTGQSLPEDTATFYEPLLAWVNECSLEKLSVTVRLDYMNSSSAQQISSHAATVRALYGRWLTCAAMLAGCDT